MTKEQALNIIKLLSGMESWSFATSHRLPDYLYEQISDAQDVLAKIILESDNGKNTQF